MINAETTCNRGIQVFEEIYNVIVRAGLQRRDFHVRVEGGKKDIAYNFDINGAEDKLDFKKFFLAVIKYWEMKEEGLSKEEIKKIIVKGDWIEDIFRTYFDKCKTIRVYLIDKDVESDEKGIVTLTNKNTQILVSIEFDYDLGKIDFNSYEKTIKK